MRFPFNLMVITVLVFFSTMPPVAAQGLSGPSSVEGELKAGDGLTDPQYRTDFPRNIAPGWFAWKDRLADNGFRFSIDYPALGQKSSSGIGAGEAASGIARFYGSWQATNNGNLTFKVEDRHAYGAVAPQFLGLDGGALAITGSANHAFNSIYQQSTSGFRREQYFFHQSACKGRVLKTGFRNSAA